MNLTLHRLPSTLSGTFGVLCIDDLPVCVTCEDPWRQNARNVSCIPEGTYKVRVRYSAKYGKHWHLQDVPGRDLILIHNGNTEDDTQGCILVGSGFARVNGKPGVVNSIPTLDMLRKRLPDEFTLTITGRESHV